MERPLPGSLSSVMARWREHTNRLPDTVKIITAWKIRQFAFP
jgi:hypothetical protein